MPEDPAAHLARQDVIYVGGGNTANMLAIWRVHGIDRALREAWERGAVLGGMERRRELLVRGLASPTRSAPRCASSATASASCREASARTTTASRSGGRPTRGSSRDGVLAAGLRRRRRRRVPLRGTASCARSSASATGARGYRVTAEGEEPTRAAAAVKRVAIVASASGSGKTTLGRELARRLDVPFLELDALHHGPDWTEATAEELRARVEPLVAEDGWVDRRRLPSASSAISCSSVPTSVVWLDLPLRVWLPRLAPADGPTNRPARGALEREPRDAAQRLLAAATRWSRCAPSAMHFGRRRLYPPELAPYNGRAPPLAARGRAVARAQPSNSLLLGLPARAPLRSPGRARRPSQIGVSST